MCRSRITASGLALWIPFTAVTTSPAWPTSRAPGTSSRRPARRSTTSPESSAIKIFISVPSRAAFAKKQNPIVVNDKFVRNAIRWLHEFRVGRWEGVLTAIVLLDFVYDAKRDNSENRAEHQALFADG